MDRRIRQPDLAVLTGTVRRAAPRSKRTPAVMVRRATTADRALIWGLNDFPNGFRLTGVGCAEVLRVRVHPAARRLRLGTAVMSELERRAATAGIERLRLDTVVNQPEAVAFYEALGYRRRGTASRPDWAWTLVYFEKDLGATD